MRVALIVLACFIASISASPIDSEALSSLIGSKPEVKEDKIPVEVKPIESKSKVLPRSVDAKLAEPTTTTSTSTTTAATTTTKQAKTTTTTTTTETPSTTEAKTEKPTESKPTKAEESPEQPKDDKKVEKQDIPKEAAESRIAEVKVGPLTVGLNAAEEKDAKNEKESEEKKPVEGKKPIYEKNPAKEEQKPTTFRPILTRGRARFGFSSAEEKAQKPTTTTTTTTTKTTTTTTTQKPTEKTTEKFIEKTTEKATEKPTKATEKPTKQPEKKTEKADESFEQKEKPVESDEKSVSKENESKPEIKGRSGAISAEERRKGKKYHEIQIVKLESELDENGKYRYNYEGEDGTLVSQEGELKKMMMKTEEDDEEVEHMGESVKGAYSFKDDEGKTYSVSYTADENGYRPVGDHIPTIPPAIARSLAWSATAKPWVDPWLVKQKKLKAARAKKLEEEKKKGGAPEYEE